jgi:hypothetical protein
MSVDDLALLAKVDIYNPSQADQRLVFQFVLQVHQPGPQRAAIVAKKGDDAQAFLNAFHAVSFFPCLRWRSGRGDFMSRSASRSNRSHFLCTVPHHISCVTSP